MNVDDQRRREEIKDRFLEISLVEVLSEAPVNEFTFAHARRSALWPSAVAAAGLLILAMVVFRGSSDDLDPISGGRIEGVVVTPTGEPVAGATVRLELGWVDYPFSPIRRWASADRLTTVTDAEGRFVLTGIPEGAVGMTFVRGPGRFARVPAESRMEVVARPGRPVDGTVVTAHALLDQLTVTCRIDGWPETEAVSPDPDGRFRFDALPEGPGIVLVKRGNWNVAVRSREDTDGIRVEEGMVVSPDPLVDANRIQAVDAYGLPRFGVKVYWSRPDWRGSSTTGSDGTGPVLMGTPVKTPLLLNLALLRTDYASYSGRLLEVTDGKAIVEMVDRRRIHGRVPNAGGAYTLYYEAGGDRPHLFTGYVKDGEFSIDVPTGPGALLVLPPDGRLHRTEIEVLAADEPLELEIEIQS